MIQRMYTGVLLGRRHLKGVDRRFRASGLGVNRGCIRKVYMEIQGYSGLGFMVGGLGFGV